jgi:hypothetical protein
MPLGCLIDDLAEQAGFADARLTFDKQDAAPSPHCMAEDLIRDPQLRVTSSHRANPRNHSLFGTISRPRSAVISI